MFEELKSKGYVVLRNVFDADLIDLIRKDYELIKNEFGFMPGYEAAAPGSKKIHYLDKVDDAIGDVYKQVELEAGIITNYTQTPAYFAIERGINTTWHQDHESYFQTGDHTHYLIIWVPIYKPSKELTNLGVINLEKLFELDPNSRFLKGLGATRLYVKNNVTHVMNENDDSEYIIPFDINTIAEYPELNVGDAVIARGDCIHQTQDTLTNRVAVSIRRLNLDSKIKKSHYDITSKTKQFIFDSNLDFAKQIAVKFNNTDEITIRDFFDVRTK